MPSPTPLPTPQPTPLPDPVFLGPAWGLPPAPHDPRDRGLITEHRGWAVRAFAWNSPHHAWLAREGMLHIQLWSPEARVSVLTPSRLTGGAYEVCLDGERTRACCWGAVAGRLVQGGVRPPEHGLVDHFYGGLVLAALVGRGSGACPPPLPA